MKIRCKNCYRVLNPNEEYCTACGEHSAAMQKAMITGDYGPDTVGKLKISLICYSWIFSLWNSSSNFCVITE